MHASCTRPQIDLYPDWRGVPLTKLAWSHRMGAWVHGARLRFDLILPDPFSILQMLVCLVVIGVIRDFITPPTSVMANPPPGAMTTAFSSASTSMFAGSIMTSFTPPSYCNNVVISACSVTTFSSGISSGEASTICGDLERDLTCGSDGRATRASECFPESPYPYRSLLTYSPAIGCPGGWKTESLIVDPASQTTAVCCPS
jgi:hypothetical protein